MVIPAPIGGWNAYNSLDDMPPQDAVVLDNFFPETTYARLRRGSSLFCDTGQSAAVQTLMEYTSGSNSKLLAAAGGHIYNVSSGTAVNLSSGFGSDVWSHTNFATPGGQFLIFANASGADGPQVYNGTAISAAVVSGVTATTLSQVLAYNQRIFYVEQGTLSCWYTSAGSFQGALTELDFSSICVRGGAIAALASWTRDNGFGGSDELFVMVSTKGEVLVYNGVNPGDATLWNLIGRFLLGEPVSGRCVTRIGPDLILLCEDGFQPLSNYLFLGGSKAQATALSQKIGNAATAAVQAGKSLAGWQGLLYPQGTCLIMNVPQTATTFHQYVVNTITGAWCRYKNLNAYCWSLFNATPYFGGAAGKVYRFDIGSNDSGADIVGEYLSAFQFPGARTLIKRFTMARPMLVTNGSVTYSLGVEMDFATANQLAAASSNPPAGMIWGTGIWGTGVWGGGLPTTPQRRWSSVSGIGYAAAAHLKVSTGTVSMQMNGIDLLYETGQFV